VAHVPCFSNGSALWSGPCGRSFGPATAPRAGGLYSSTAGLHMERHLHRRQRRLLFRHEHPFSWRIEWSWIFYQWSVAGGTIGGNYQTGAFVFGVEGDFDWDNIKGNPSACIGCQVSSTWLATARGRVGVAWDRLLFYGTGGVAFQNVKFAVTAPPLTAPLATTVNAIGWTAGGGVEYALSPNWSVKAEYLYVNFNNQTIGPGTFTLIENVVRGGVNYRF
jgi:opacity protein-like surface antigen